MTTVLVQEAGQTIEVLSADKIIQEASYTVEITNQNTTVQISAAANVVEISNSGMTVSIPAYQTTVEVQTQGAQGPPGEGGSSAYSIRIDETGLYTYVGEADPGTSEGAAAWRIKRLTESEGPLLYADGDSNFNNIWNDRAILSYS